MSDKNPQTKLQTRKKLVSIVSKYKGATIVKNEQILKDVDSLAAFEDKEYTLKFLLSEMASEKTLNANICALFILEIFDKELLSRVGIDFLINKKIPDGKKFFLISILKQKGVDIDYDDISDYIENPDDIAKEGVRKFLKDIINDPEVQIDLLDFYINIPEVEKVPLIKNILEETDTDNISIVLTLIIQLLNSVGDYSKQEFSLIFNKLLEINSPYAIYGLEYVLNNYNLDKTQITATKKRIKELKFKNPKFENNHLIKNSKPHKSYISFIDGQSNFSLIFSRINPDKTLNVFLTTINTNIGMISCMGFSKITKDNFSAILQRLFYDSMPVEINPVALKGLLKYFLQKNKTSQTQVPYEFIVWQHLTDDIEEINYDIKEFIQSKLDTINLDEFKVQKFTTSKMLSSWYYSKNENKLIDKLIKEIEKEHITSFTKLSLFIDDFIDNEILTDKDFLEELKTRLLILAYVTHLAKLKMSSLCAYSLYFESKFTKPLVKSIIDKSIYYYFISLENILGKKDNIFKRKNDTSYTKEEMSIIIDGFNKQWNQRKE